MKKLLVSLVAVVTAVGAVSADCAGNGAGCKPKKYRVIRISAANPDSLYGDKFFEGTRDTVAPDYRMESYDSVETYDDAEWRDTKRPLQLSERGGAARSSDWYIGGRVGLHLLSWKNKYRAIPSSYNTNNEFKDDEYIFEPVFGGGVFAGHKFGDAWRGDVEFGYLTQFSDSDSGFTFKLSAPYLMANVYYDFIGGFYLGGGVGFAFPKMKVEWAYFDEPIDNTKLSFIGGLMAGYAHHLSDSVVLDFRYRLAGFIGPKSSENLNAAGQADFPGLTGLEVKTGLILDNSLSLGVRFEF